MRHLIGLGFRCDVAFQLRMHGTENVAHFFDWLATPADGLIKIIEADFNLFAPDHLVLKTDHNPHCVEDRYTGTVFHHQFPLFGGHVQPNFLLFHSSFIKKFGHLAARFRLYLQTRPVTLVRHLISHEQAVRLEDAMRRRFPDADMRFLYLLDEGETFTTPLGHARILQNDHSSLGDPAAWAALLRSEGLIETPYRHGTAEILGSAHDDHNLSTDNRFSESQLLAAIAANPTNVAFPLELSQWYAARGRMQDSEDMAIGALARAPDHPGAMFQAAMIQFRRGRMDAKAAAAAFMAVVGRSPPRAAWLTETAAALREAGQGEKALEYASRAVLAAPMFKDGYLQKAICLLEQGDFIQAGFAMEAAIALGPIGHVNRHRYATILGRQDKLADAVEVERQVLVGHPNFFPSLVNLAGLLARQGHRDEALAAYRRAAPLAGIHAQAVEGQIRKLEHSMSPVES